MSYLLAGGAWTGSGGAAQHEGRRTRAPPRRLLRIPARVEGTTMGISRRLFIRDGVATVTLGLAAPVVPERDRAGAGHPVATPRRRLSRRRQRCAQHADLLSGRRPTTAAVRRLPCLRARCCRWAPTPPDRRSGCIRGWAACANIFNEGRLALVQRTGYPNSSRSHFEATDIWGTANPQSSTGSGWLGRYLDTLPRPLDALAAWNTTGETPRALLSGQSGVPAIPNATTYTYREPEPRLGRAAGAGGRAGDGGATRRPAGRIWHS